MDCHRQKLEELESQSKKESMIGQIQEQPITKEHQPIKKHSCFSSKNSTEAQIEGQTFKIVNKVYINDSGFDFLKEEHKIPCEGKLSNQDISALSAKNDITESSDQFAFIDLCGDNEECEFEVVPNHLEKKPKTDSGLSSE